VGGTHLLILLVLTPAATSSEEELLASANAAFREGAQLAATPEQSPAARKAFARAAQRFDQLGHGGIENASLCRNQGNAFLLANDLPRAILAYRRGLQLAPNDPELRRCLAYAREQVVYPPPGQLGRPAIEHRPPWLPHLPASAFWLTFAMYSVGCLAVARWRMVHRGGWLMVGGLAFVGTALLGAALVWEDREQREEERLPLVVVAEDNVLLRRGNGLDYSSRFPANPLNRGVEARLLHERGNWLQIQLGGGEVGWVPRSFTIMDRSQRELAPLPKLLPNQ